MLLPSSTSLLCVRSMRWQFFCPSFPQFYTPWAHLRLDKVGNRHVAQLFGFTVLGCSFVSLKIRQEKYLSGEFCSDNQSAREAEELPGSQTNCILLFHFKRFIIVNTERTPDLVKIREHQLCYLLAYRNISLLLATDTPFRKKNMVYSVVNIMSLGKPQLEICFLLTHFPWASASLKTTTPAPQKTKEHHTKTQTTNNNNKKTPTKQTSQNFKWTTNLYSRKFTRLQSCHGKTCLMS